MKLLKLSVLMLITIPAIMLNAQIKGVVIDQTTGESIANVSIYAKNNDKVLGTASNEKGEFTVDFPFTSLFFTHISYEKIEIKKENLKNIVELAPTSILLGEVVINSKQPAWIVQKLKEIVKQKAKNYQTAETQMSYNFTSTTLD